MTAGARLIAASAQTTPAQTAAAVAIQNCGRGTGLFYDAWADIERLTDFPVKTSAPTVYR